MPAPLNSKSGNNVGAYSEAEKGGDRLSLTPGMGCPTTLPVGRASRINVRLGGQGRLIFRLPILGAQLV